MNKIIRTIVEKITGEPMPEGTSPYRLLLTAAVVAFVLYVVLAATLSLN